MQRRLCFAVPCCRLPDTPAAVRCALPPPPPPHPRPQAIIDDSSKTEAQRKAAREQLKKQAEEAKALAAKMETEAREKEELEKRIKEMEGKVGRAGGGGGARGAAARLEACMHARVRGQGPGTSMPQIYAPWCAMMACSRVWLLQGSLTLAPCKLSGTPAAA